MKRIPLFALVPLAAIAVTAACSPVGGYCEAAAECDDREAQFLGLDPVGESNDSVNVCVAQSEGVIRTLRANEEEGCQEEADALLAYYACVADTFRADPRDACDGLVFDPDRNPCFDELDDFFDSAGDNGDDCSPNEE
jgi:hypothetical protein